MIGVVSPRSHEHSVFGRPKARAATQIGLSLGTAGLFLGLARPEWQDSAFVIAPLGVAAISGVGIAEHFAHLGNLRLG